MSLCCCRFPCVELQLQSRRRDACAGGCQCSCRSRSVRLHAVPALQRVRQRHPRLRRHLRAPLLQPMSCRHSHAQARRCRLGLCRRHSSARRAVPRGAARRCATGHVPLASTASVLLTRVNSCCGTAQTLTPRPSAARRRCTSPWRAAGRTFAKYCLPTAATPTPPPLSSGRRLCTGVALARNAASALSDTNRCRAVVDLQPRLVVLLLRCAPTTHLPHLCSHLHTTCLRQPRRPSM